MYCCITNYHKFSAWKLCIYRVTISVGVESGHGLVRSFALGSLMSLLARCQTRQGSHLIAHLEKVCFQNHALVGKV